MQKIKKLSNLLAQQIAAGEVIERPASVVKELIENSIDAGATKITLDIAHGGKKQIIVEDNGCGISKEDLLLAIEQHATSKISTIEDLSRIATLGFRGEALSSLVGISRLEIITKTIEQQLVFKITTTPGNSPVINVSSGIINSGTKVIVKDLFYNIPARCKFLRTDRTEFLQIENLFKKLAFSHTNIHFILKHNTKIIYDLIANQPEQRLQKICGKSCMAQMRPIDLQHAEYKLSGWIVGLDGLRAATDNQYFYINQRSVSDRLLNHAIRQAYYEATGSNKYPAYVLYLETKPELIDVNVHPTKQEVRFEEPRIVHDFIADGLNRSLGANIVDDLIPEIHTSNHSKSKSNHIVIGDKFLLVMDKKSCYCIDARYWLQQYYLAKFSDGSKTDVDYEKFSLDSKMCDKIIEFFKAHKKHEKFGSCIINAEILEKMIYVE